jgi:hypothetical protein
MLYYPRSMIVCLPTRHAGGAMRVSGPQEAAATFDFSRHSGAGAGAWAAFRTDATYEIESARAPRSGGAVPPQRLCHRRVCAALRRV